MKGRESGVIVSRVDFDWVEFKRQLPRRLVANANHYGHAWSFEAAFSANGQKGSWRVVFWGRTGEVLPYTVATYTTKCEAEQAAAEMTLEAALS